MPDFFENPKIVNVLVIDPVDKAYSYKVPTGIELGLGDYVLVPIGKHAVEGVVWSVPEDPIDPKIKLKEVFQKFDVPSMSEAQRKFVDWVASYTLSRKGSVLKMAVSVTKALEEDKPVPGYKIADASDVSLSEKQQAVLDILKDGIARRANDIAKHSGCSSSVVVSLAKKNVLEKVDIRPPAPCIHPDHEREILKLSDAQSEGAVKLKNLIKSEYNVCLLDGVTGSGKTEVYFEAVAQALAQDKQVLILLPEIALSNAFLDRFQARFGCAPCLWHSGLTPAQRRRNWRGVAMGESKVVIGARSSLFLPFKDLGVIIVDEEHDPAYKQEEGVIYHARDMAVVRAHLEKIPCILVSATPSVETFENVHAKRYQNVRLPDRFGGAVLPDISLIDMRVEREDSQHFISKTLIQAMSEALEKKEQVLLFLNRRGYAPLTLCRTCGHRYECPRCTAWLVEHKGMKQLQCHHCGYGQGIPESCASCSDTDSLVACGPGVERIFDEVKELFPDHKSLIFSSDTAEGESLHDILTKIRNRDIDIIIGTQIIAKGHHFPKLTCVGIIDADLGLSGGDLRASERCYQLLHQVSGRAGRAADKGHVYIQTFMPDSLVMQALASGKRDQFIDIELAGRANAKMPPFSRLVALIVSGREEALVLDSARKLGLNAPQGEKVRTLGPAPAPIYKLRGRYRQRLLVSADKSIHIQQTIHHWIKATKIPSKIKIQIDVDPQSFF